MARRLFDDTVVLQAAFVTPDIEKTKKWMAEFFGVDLPETSVTRPQAEAETEYLGGPSEARAKLAFFPLGNLTAEVRVRADQALVFQVYPREFPRHTVPLFAFEDLPASTSGGFGEAGRVWFGGDAGLRAYRTKELDAETQATVAKMVEALRRDALAFFDWRHRARSPTRSRADYDRLARAERTLERTAEARRDLAQAAGESADRLSPRRGDKLAVRAAELFSVGPLKPMLGTTEPSRRAP